MKTGQSPVLVLIGWLLLGGLSGSEAQERPRRIAQTPAAETRSTTAPRALAGGVDDEVVRVNTRVVFIDTLVKDKLTNEPVRDLSASDFQVFDDNQPRRLTYFTREGDTRRPLALVLFIDIWAMYGKDHLRSVAAMQSLASALSKLAPEDQVAVMTTWIEEGEPPSSSSTVVPACKVIDSFTVDRARTTAALLGLPEIIKQQEQLLERLTGNSSGSLAETTLEVVWKLPDVAVQVTGLRTAAARNSQMVVVGLIDDLFDLGKGDREAAVEMSLRADLAFNGLIFKKSLAAKIFFGTMNKIFMKPRGTSLHAADYLAKQTGGEVRSVGRADDLALGLSSFIDSLAARYNLGFTLAENESGDGQLHQLEVRVRARDKRGKERKLEVRARGGYYMPTRSVTPNPFVKQLTAKQ